MVTVFGLLDGQIASNIKRILIADKGTELLDVRSDHCPNAIATAEPDVLLSAGYQHILDADTLKQAGRAINCHWSYLPYARGANTNVWPIVDDHKAGVSIHVMTPTVDAGPIIARRPVEIEPDDTGRDLYERLLEEQTELFAEHWGTIRNNEYMTQTNPVEEGTHHYSHEFNDLCALDMDTNMTLGEAIDLLRALTFKPYKNAYFEQNGQKYYVNIEIEPADH